MIWKPVLGLEGAYEASSAGDIRNIKTGVIRKAVPTYKGYLTVQIPCPKEGRHKNRTVHGIIAEAFFGPRPPGLQVNHLDGNKANNAVSNLEWATQSKNMKHAASLGLLKSPKGKPHLSLDQNGGKNPNVKLSEKQAIEIIEALSNGSRICDLARKYQISEPLIHAIKSGTRWRHLARPV